MDWEKYRTDNSTPDNSSGKWDKYAVKTDTQTTQSKNTQPTDWMGAGKGALAGAGAAGAVYGLGKWLGDPRDAYQDIKSQLVGMKGEMGISDRPFEDIPKVLGEQAKTIESESGQQIAQLTTQQQLRKQELQNQLLQQKSYLENTDLQNQLRIKSYEDALTGVKGSTNAIKNQLESFDNNVMSKVTGDLAKDIKMQYPAFFKQGSQYFKTGQMALEKHFADAGGHFDTDEFSSMLEKSIEKLRKGGVPEDQIARLQNLHNYLNPADEHGTYLPSRPMTVQEASGHISGITSDSPFDAVSSEMRGKWLDFLEGKSTGELKTEVGELNSWYRRFKTSQEQLLSLSGKGGEFNTRGLQKWMLDYYKNRTNDNIIDLMKYLSDGSSGIKMENVEGGLQKYLDAIKSGDNIKNNIKSLQKSGEDISSQISKAKVGALSGKESTLKNINKISEDLGNLAIEGIKNKSIKEAELTAKLEKIRLSSEKYTALAGKLTEAGEKIPLRGVSPLKVIRAIAKLGSGKLFSMTPTLLGAVGLGVLDPTQAVLKAEGMDMGDIERGKELWGKYQRGEGISESEKKELENFGLIT